jgi:hypothetical protein
MDGRSPGLSNKAAAVPNRGDEIPNQIMITNVNVWNGVSCDFKQYVDFIRKTKRCIETQSTKRKEKRR